MISFASFLVCKDLELERRLSVTVEADSTGKKRRGGGAQATVVANILGMRPGTNLMRPIFKKFKNDCP